VYAGGDDVLALLPLEDACLARSASWAYVAAFPKHARKVDDLAAIEFAHIKSPLTRVLHDAHELLTLWRRKGAPPAGGRAGVEPWRVSAGMGHAWERAVADGRVIVEDLARQFGSESPEYTNRFFFKIRERFEFLNPQSQAPHRPLGRPASQFLAAEYSTRRKPGPGTQLT